MNTLVEKGARNVQLLASVGKKGRPGHVLMIDIAADREAEVAAVLGADLGVWGYRVLQSEHKHFDIEQFEATVEVHAGGTVSSFPLRVKRVLNAGELLRIKAEHDDLSAICTALRAEGRTISLAVLKSQVEAAVGTAAPGYRIQVRLD